MKASEEDKVCDNEAVNYSDVSDKEIDASQSSRDLSVSPINSDQSESFEKAATLEGLNPEAISPEEDFTSLSEEEEGELKNYERRKQLKIRKKELQKKVKELERQVIEISPDSAPLDLNGLLEDGEINTQAASQLLRVNGNHAMMVNTTITPRLCMVMKMAVILSSSWLTALPIFG